MDHAELGNPLGLQHGQASVLEPSKSEHGHEMQYVVHASVLFF